MVNHLLETSHPPLPSSALNLCVSAADRPSLPFLSFLYLLTSLPPYLLFSVHTSKFRIPQPLCLPLLRKHRGVWGYSSHFGTRHSPLLFWLEIAMSNSIVVGGMRGTACSASEPRGPLGPRHGLELRQVGIRHRHDQQSQQQAKCLPANDRYRNRGALIRTGSDADSYRDQSGDDGKR